MYLGVNADQRKQNLGDCEIQLIISNHLLRFDFESFSMASQQIGTAAATGGTNVGSVVGGCKTDQFSIDGPKAGSPVICGTNTGQHSEKTFISDDVAKTP